jgi:predicted ArsR family transcriptional regulator
MSRTTVEKVEKFLRESGQIHEDDIAPSMGGLTSSQVRGSLAALKRMGRAKYQIDNGERVWQAA